MLIDIGPAVFNTAEPVFAAACGALGIGIILLIIAALIENGRKYNDAPWYAVGGILAGSALLVGLVSGLVASQNHTVIQEERRVQAAEAAGYTQIQDGPDYQTVLGKDDEGNLVLLHITEYSDTEYLVNRIEG